MNRPIARIIDLVDPASQRLWNVGLEDARTLLLADDPAAVLSMAGSFALVAQDGERVCSRGASTARCATSSPRPPTARC